MHQGGAVGSLQLFGGALQAHPHFHLLLPEGLWHGDTFVPLPPPEDADVTAVLHRVLRRLRPRLAALEQARPDEDEAGLQEASTQRVLLDVPAKRPGGRRLAVAHGFSLHADTAVHANDRLGLETLCRYGSRGAVAESRLRRMEDGRFEYRPKRCGAVVLTAAGLLLRLLALVPPRGLHLTRDAGVFAPNASLRGVVARPRSPPPPPPSLPRTRPPLADGPRRPRLDWAAVQQRTFGDDAYLCPCGGRRAVLAVVTNPRTAEEVLRNLGLLAPRPQGLPPSQAPPQPSLGL